MDDLSNLLETKPTKTVSELLADPSLPKGGRQLLEFVESQASRSGSTADPVEPSPQQTSKTAA